MSNTIYEYEEVTNNDLKDHIINTSELHKYFKLEWRTLKARQYCGILNFNGIDFYLLPKIANHNDDQNLNIFIYMLKYVYNIKLENENIGSSQNIKTKNLLEMFIQLFAHTLLIELKKGIYKEYITEQDNLTTLKGKYLINENIKHNFTKNKIYCEFDEFSANNSLNQFFLYTIKYLQKFVKEKKLLKQCELIFDEVENLTIDINKLNIHFNRLNQRFKTSYEVALLLLQRSIPLFSQGKKSFAFLFDMNILFEKFIAKVVKSIDLKAKIQNKKNCGDLILKPDIILDNLIIDTKYKKLKSIDDIKQSDKLQAFAYGINYRVDKIILLYPKHLDEVDENLVLGENERKVSLKIKSVNLNYNGIYLDYLKEIKQRVEMKI